MNEFYESVNVVAEAFGKSAGNDYKLGKIVKEDREFRAAWEVLRTNDKAQKLLMERFYQAHGNDTEILSTLDNIIKMFAAELIIVSPFGAVAYIVGKAEVAYVNGAQM